MASLNDQVINDILQCNIRNINVKYNSNKIIKFKSAVLWEQAMFSHHINLRTSKHALLRDQRFLSTFHRNGVTEHTLRALSTLKIKADFYKIGLIRGW